MGKNVSKGVTTASQLAQQLYQEKYRSQFALVMSEIIGLLDYLEEQQKVQVEWSSGVRHYTLAERIR